MLDSVRFNCPAIVVLRDALSEVVAARFVDSSMPMATETVSAVEGWWVGTGVGCVVGRPVGAGTGISVGDGTGTSLGKFEGMKDKVGLMVGVEVGSAVGAVVGIPGLVGHANAETAL